VAVAAVSVRKALGADGLFNQKVARFQPRESQLQLAEAIAACIHDQATLMAEAGTGTGKTFAYLVPVLQSGRKAIISTGTKNLQQQLFERDLPQVARLLGVNPRLRLLKGRGNYFCSYRFNQARAGDIGKKAEFRASLRIIDPWLRRTREGDLAELSGLPENTSLRSHLTSTPENCLGNECPDFESCYVMRARRRAQEADVLVVNHHLLFADMALKENGYGELLPKVQTVVLDEAHQVPATASRFFSQNFSDRQCTELINDATREAGEVTGGFETLKTPLEHFQQDVRNAKMQLCEGGDSRSGALADLLQREKVAESLSLLKHSLVELTATLRELATRSSGLERVYQRADDLAMLLGSWLEGENADSILWYTVESNRFSLHATPLDVSRPLQQFRQATPAAWVLTSATLAVNRKFDHFKRATGLTDARELLVDSPFDYASQALLYAPADMPEPHDRYYRQAVLDKAQPVIEACPGGVFFLFTSHFALQNAARELRQRLPDRPLFVQGDAPRHQLLEEFRAAGNGLLLGAASFWEGIDVVGEKLSCVIIDKLPFAHPDDPVLKARIQHIKDSGGNPFTEYQLPAAAIALKQGAGRLIRSASDRGVLMLCDPRLFSKPYGKVLLRSLPAMPVSHDLETVSRFFAGAG
jgi:ATP-dependent DNA helicase DinG